MNRDEAFHQLSLIPQHANLYGMARDHGIVIRKNDKLNKGWIGQALEKVIGLETSLSPMRDGSDFELKSVTLIEKGGVWTPKETIKVTQLNPETILEEEFETSALWMKLKRLIIVGVRHQPNIRCEVLKTFKIDILDEALISQIQGFWQDVRDVIASGEFSENYKLGTSDDLIQLRPTGSGKDWSTCPITGNRFPARAFYATKRLLELLMI